MTTQRAHRRGPRPGELIAGAGGVVLLVDLFLRWYRFGIAPAAQDQLLKFTGVRGPSNGHGYDDAFNALSVLGPVLLAVALAAIALAAVASVARAAPLPLAAGTVCAVPSTLVLPFLLYRVIFAPALGAEHSDRLVHVSYGAYIGFAATAMIVVGAWMSVRDERPTRRQRGAPEPTMLRLPTR